MNRNTKPIRHQGGPCMFHMGLWSLTVVFETVPLRLRLKRTKSDLAPIFQDPALPAADLNSVDL